jgi:F-type H+-transporting ATPase subunit delta
MVDPVTTRFATALFELARDKGALAEVQSDVDALAKLLATPQARRLFDGRVPFDEKRKVIESAASGKHRLTSNFLRMLVDKRRIEVLQGLPEAFRRRALAERNTVEGVVEAPRALGPGELAEITVALKSLLGKEVLLESRTNPDLLAGVRVFVDNRLIDQSAVGRLEGLRGKLLRTRVS